MKILNKNVTKYFMESKQKNNKKKNILLIDHKLKNN